LISAVRKLIVKSQPHFAFQEGNTGSFLKKEAENSDYLNQLNVSKPSVASISLAVIGEISWTCSFLCVFYGFVVLILYELVIRRPLAEAVRMFLG
jgi:hypothetical protein